MTHFIGSTERGWGQDVEWFSGGVLEPADGGGARAGRHSANNRHIPLTQLRVRLLTKHLRRVWNDLITFGLWELFWSSLMSNVYLISKYVPKGKKMIKNVIKSRLIRCHKNYFVNELNNINYQVQIQGFRKGWSQVIFCRCRTEKSRRWRKLFL